MLLATPRGQGRGRTVIPGFAVRYISIMLPSQTRHLMCQSQTVVLPSPLPLFLHMRWRAEHSIWPARVTREEGTTSFSLALLFLIESSKPLYYWYRGQIEGCFCLVSNHAYIRNFAYQSQVVLLKISNQFQVTWLYSFPEKVAHPAQRIHCLCGSA